MSNFDNLVFEFLYNLTLNNSPLKELIIFFTEYSFKMFVIIYIIGIIILLIQKNDKIFPFIIGPATTYITSRLIRFFYIRPRPFVSLKIDGLIEHLNSGSLPSMHAVCAFIIGLSIWNIHKKSGRYIIILAVLVSLSRVMAGMHFPSDILVSLLLALLFYWVFFLILNREDYNKLIQYIKNRK